MWTVHRSRNAGLSADYRRPHIDGCRLERQFRCDAGTYGYTVSAALKRFRERKLLISVLARQTRGPTAG
jgi:hypothetical protein